MLPHEINRQKYTFTGKLFPQEKNRPSFRPDGDK